MTPVPRHPDGRPATTLTTMAETDPADDLPASRESAPGERYATLDLTQGETVIYDRENPRAWLQSDGAVSVASMT